MALLTEEIVRKAIELALPTIRELTKGFTWGPQGVAIAVEVKGLPLITYVMPELGPKETWKNRKGEPLDFVEVASQKASLARRNGNTSLSVVNDHPWSLEKDDFTYQGGVAEDTDMAVGASGAYGYTDEACAWIVWNCICLLCRHELAQMQAQGINRL